MIHQQIKDDLKNSMKSKSILKDYIKVVLSEFDRIGKDLSDEQSISIIKKLHKNAVQLNNNMEITYLECFLPKLMSENEIETQIAHYINSGINNFGQLMGAFNKQFKGKADNKLVSTVTKKLLNT